MYGISLYREKNGEPFWLTKLARHAAPQKLILAGVNFGQNRCPYDPKWKCPRNFLQTVSCSTVCCSTLYVDWFLRYRRSKFKRLHQIRVKNHVKTGIFPLNRCNSDIFWPILMNSTWNNFSKTLVLEMCLIQIAPRVQKLFNFKVVKVFKNHPV